MARRPPTLDGMPPRAFVAALDAATPGAAGALFDAGWLLVTMHLAPRLTGDSLEDFQDLRAHMESDPCGFVADAIDTVRFEAPAWVRIIPESDPTRWPFYQGIVQAVADVLDLERDG